MDKPTPKNVKWRAVHRCDLPPQLQANSPQLSNHGEREKGRKENDIKCTMLYCPWLLTFSFLEFLWNKWSYNFEACN